jgi:hypothetical protein
VKVASIRHEAQGRNLDLSPIDDIDGLLQCNWVVLVRAHSAPNLFDVSEDESELFISKTITLRVVGVKDVLAFILARAIVAGERIDAKQLGDLRASLFAASLAVAGAAIVTFQKVWLLLSGFAAHREQGARSSQYGKLLFGHISLCVTKCARHHTPPPLVRWNASVTKKSATKIRTISPA